MPLGSRIWSSAGCEKRSSSGRINKAPSGVNAQIARTLPAPRMKKRPKRTKGVNERQIPNKVHTISAVEGWSSCHPILDAIKNIRRPLEPRGRSRKHSRLTRFYRRYRSLVSRDNQDENAWGFKQVPLREGRPRADATTDKTQGRGASRLRRSASASRPSCGRRHTKSC